MVPRVAIHGLLFGLLFGCRDVHPAQQGPDAAAAPDAAAHDAAAPDADPNDPDGTPMRRPCTTAFGSALSPVYGRLDGFLVAIVPPGTGGCHADTTHLHLQVLMGGAVYDVAVNVGTNDATNDVHSAPLDHALIGPAWSEGWHTTVAVDYPTLGVHSDALPLHTQTENVAALTAELATANHVSIYATGYTTFDGAHLVHHNPTNHDGMVVTHPLSATAHARLFSFSTQAPF